MLPSWLIYTCQWVNTEWVDYQYEKQHYPNLHTSCYRRHSLWCPQNNIHKQYYMYMIDNPSAFTVHSKKEDVVCINVP